MKKQYWMSFFAVMLLSLAVCADSIQNYSDVKGFGLIGIQGGLWRPWNDKASQMLLDEVNAMRKASGLPPLKLVLPPGKLETAKGIASYSLAVPYYHRQSVTGCMPSGTYGVRISGVESYLNDTVFGCDLAAFEADSNRVCGIQLSGLDASVDNLYGFQIASWMAFSAKEADGLQAAVFLAEAEKVSGIQLSVFCNFVGNFNGLQASVDTNISTKEGNGVQCTVLTNKATVFNGLQIGGFGNYISEKINGLQIGLINHAESGSVVQIGLINRIKNGYFNCLPFINFNF